MAAGKKPPFIPIIVGLLVLGGAAAGGFVFMQKRAGDPGAVVKDFMAALSKFDLDGMGRCLTASAASQIELQKKMLNDPRAKQSLEMMKSAFKVENVQILDTTYEGETARVKVKYTATVNLFGMNKSETKEDTIALVKENGQWKMQAPAGGMGGRGGGMGKMGGAGPLMGR